MIMMPYSWRWSSLQLTGQADFWHPTGPPGKPGAPASPTETPQSATRRLIPTEIPRTKRHTPVHLLCVLKVRRTAGDQRGCAWAGLLELFQVSAFRVIEPLLSGRSAVCALTLPAPPPPSHRHPLRGWQNKGLLVAESCQHDVSRFWR